MIRKLVKIEGRLSIVVFFIVRLLDREFYVRVFFMLFIMGKWIFVFLGKESFGEFSWESKLLV